MIPVFKPSLGKEELDLIKEVFNSNWLGFGSYVIDFENVIRDFIGAKNVIAVNSGTSALHLALESSGVSSGDEVIVPSLTFCASVQAITALGAKPIFCEVLPSTLCIDTSDILPRITSKTKAIMPIHYCGIAAQMDVLLDIGAKNNIVIIEDAAHAFGSSFNGLKLGSFGNLTCFSFDPIKNITCGEGGAITTNNDELAHLIRKKRILGIEHDSWYRREHNLDWHYEITTQGYRYHMNNINAAIGLSQFKKIDSFRSAKIKIVKLYNEAFSQIGNISTMAWNLNEDFPFAYVIRISKNRRNGLKNFLKQKGIDTGINYIPNHLHPFFNTGLKLPVTEKIYEEIITLPLFTDMNEQEITYVINNVFEFFKNNTP
jgi:dTDP-4-amino-4,6-dideoxygalactose transaminase